MNTYIPYVIILAQKWVTVQTKGSISNTELLSSVNDALSFYTRRSKMILDRPNCFEYNSFRTGTNYFGGVQVRFFLLKYLLYFVPDQNELGLSKTICNRPKWFVQSKIILDQGISDLKETILRSDTLWNIHLPTLP